MTQQTYRGASPKASANGAVIDVDERNFESAVLARSREVPVIVDFWAPWCGPCRTLGPTLERLAQESNGAFVLAKVNVDENQRLAAVFQVQSIPAVKAFRDGKLVDEFMGALPESQIRAWLKRLVPSEGDELVKAAEALEISKPQEAIARYRLALGSDPSNTAALFGLGRLLTMEGDPEGAKVLAEIPAGTPFSARAQALQELDTFFNGAKENKVALEARVAANANDWEARYQLAAVEARSNNYGPAFEHLLTIVGRNRAFLGDGARKAMLGLFALLGDEHPLVPEYRRKLSGMLF
jgi:putative thioredoxin